jgi:hypothetical protein
MRRWPRALGGHPDRCAAVGPNCWSSSTSLPAFSPLKIRASMLGNMVMSPGTVSSMLIIHALLVIIRGRDVDCGVAAPAFSVE